MYRELEEPRDRLDAKSGDKDTDALADCRCACSESQAAEDDAPAPSLLTNNFLGVKMNIG